MSRLEGIVLLLMTQVRDLGTSYFDSSGSASTIALLSGETVPRLPPVECEAANSALQLATTLLAQGYGLLAGKLVRKAFLQIESMFQLHSPVFLWNMLEMLYTVVSPEQLLEQQHKNKLCEIILAHLIDLAGNRYPEVHPLVHIFHCLHDSFRDSGPEPSREPQQRLGHMLAQAWALNSAIVVGQLLARAAGHVSRHPMGRMPSSLPCRPAGHHKPVARPTRPVPLP